MYVAEPTHVLELAIVVRLLRVSQRYLVDLIGVRIPQTSGCLRRKGATQIDEIAL